jgi:hypothetical protein
MQQTPEMAAYLFKVAAEAAEAAVKTLKSMHPVWLRTQGLCVAYSMDVEVLRQLCGACPQLAANLQLLLQPI